MVNSRLQSLTCAFNCQLALQMVNVSFADKRLKACGWIVDLAAWQFESLWLEADIWSGSTELKRAANLNWCKVIPVHLGSHHFISRIYCILYDFCELRLQMLLPTVCPKCWTFEQPCVDRNLFYDVRWSWYWAWLVGNCFTMEVVTRPLTFGRAFLNFDQTLQNWGNGIELWCRFSLLPRRSCLIHLQFECVDSTGVISQRFYKTYICIFVK